MTLHVIEKKNEGKKKKNNKDRCDRVSDRDFLNERWEEGGENCKKKGRATNREF